MLFDRAELLQSKYSAIILAAEVQRVARLDMLLVLPGPSGLLSPTRLPLLTLPSWVYLVWDPCRASNYSELSEAKKQTKISSTATRTRKGRERGEKADLVGKGIACSELDLERVATLFSSSSKIIRFSPSLRFTDIRLVSNSQHSFPHSKYPTIRNRTRHQ